MFLGRGLSPAGGAGRAVTAASPPAQSLFQGCEIPGSARLQLNTQSEQMPVICISPVLHHPSVNWG